MWITVTRAFQICLVLSVSLAVLSLLEYFLWLPPQIPLFYSLPRTQDWLAAREWIFLFPFLGLLLTYGQLPLLRINGENDDAARTFAWANALILGLIFVAFLRITSLVL